MGQSGVIDINGRQVLPCQYHYLTEPSCGLMMCIEKEGDKAGYINLTGDFVIPPQFDNAGIFERGSGLAWVSVTRNGTDYYGLINLRGELVIPAIHAGIDSSGPSEGLLKYCSYDHHKQYGYLDVRGNVVIPPHFRSATRFSCGLARVTYPDDLDHSFFIDHSGRRVLGPYAGEADYTSVFSEDGIARVCDPKSGQWYFINPSGQTLLVPPPGLLAGEFAGGLARTWDIRAKRFGFIDVSGAWVIPPKYDDVIGFIRGYAKMMVDDRWGIIDVHGREIVPPRYSSSGDLGLPSCQRIRYCDTPSGSGESDRYGYLSLTGQVAIPPTFTGAGTFSEGFATVEDS